MTHPVSNLRVLALAGHAGAGKTTLTEALLAAAGAVAQPGSVERGSTVTDYDALEKSHAHSLRLACAHFEKDDVRVQILDAPGYPDFAGRAMAALDAVETLGIVVNAQNGVEMTARRMALWAQSRKLCRFIVVNHIDAERLDLEALLDSLRHAFGSEALPINLPADGGKRVVDCFFNLTGDATDFSSIEAAHEAIVEQVIEVDDALTERYLSGETIEPEALHDAFEQALREGHLLPILFTSAATGAGVRELLDFIVRLAPNPTEGNPPMFEKWPGGDRAKAEEFVPTRNPDDHVLAHVFKVEVDPYVGTVGYVRVHQGTIRPDTQLYVGDSRKAVKVGAIGLPQGKEASPLPAAGPGEICTVSKIDDLHFDAVLHDAQEDSAIHFKPLPIPHAVYGLAIGVKKRGDEQKLAEVMQRLCAEDPSLSLDHDQSTNEIVVRGLGEMHVQRIIERAQLVYKLELDAHPPTIPYRETLT
ncbi:MAG: elongation factor G, partial [Burkholderiales bacterium]